MRRDTENRLARLEAQAAPIRFVVGADLEECERKRAEAGGNAVMIVTGVPRSEGWR